MNYNFLYNPLEIFFGKLKPKKESDEEKAILKNSLAVSEDDLISKTKGIGNFGGSVVNNHIQFEQIFQTKEAKISKYTEMEDYPEIADALDQVSDEAIIQDPEGKVVNLNIQDEENIPRKIVKQIRDESDYILERIFKIKKRGWPLFRRFLCEGEVFLEKILSDDKKSIVGLKIIPPFRIVPSYESNIIKEFIHGTLKKEANGLWTEDNIKMPSTQIAYVNYGEYINRDITNPKSYLYAAIRPYNQLRNLEDSLIVYRISRAVEKRVFNIEVGQMPAGKAREYLSKMINQFKRVTNYDSNTGQIQSSQNLMSINEDFWFTQNNGQGSKVDTLQSGMNLGKLDDVEYFLKKLYKCLKMPSSRWKDDTSLFQGGKGSEISREELKFDKFIGRVQDRFKDLFVDCLITQLKLKGVSEEFCDAALYEYSFSKGNYFSEYKNLELNSEKFGLLNTISPQIWSPTNPQGIFAKKYILKKILMMSDEEIQENQDFLDEIKEDEMNSHYDDKLASSEIEAGVADKVKAKKEKEKNPFGKKKNESLEKEKLGDYDCL